MNNSAGVRPPSDGRRLLLGGPDLKAHLAAYGPLPARPADLLGELGRSGLTGRGGAGFPTWQKLAATVNAPSRRRPVVIANGAEGEPVSVKDATLLQTAPHLVIDGLLIAGAALGTNTLYLYATAVNAIHVEQALRGRSDARNVRVVQADDTFIAGEASAVVNAIETKRALPRDRVQRLSESGVNGRPTLLYNVETFAHIALIARFGADWFRSVGTQDDPGTRLVTVSGDVGLPGVYEVSGGTSLRPILLAAAADPERVRAVLVGGYHGVWVPADRLDTTLSPEGLASFGGQPGAGVILVVDENRCGLVVAAEIVDYLAEQSARQCGACMFGLPAMSATMRRLARGETDHSLPAELRRLSALVEGRGACHHPDGTAGFVLSTLAVFTDDVELHLRARCEAAAHLNRTAS
jgi:NADH:ubiquinone oxidoreductase subunit F (NADH-binding)